MPNSLLDSQTHSHHRISPLQKLSTGIAFHWMSTSQPPSDFWVQKPDMVDRDAYEANKQQAAADWLQLLRLRAKELMSGWNSLKTPQASC